MQTRRRARFGGSLVGLVCGFALAFAVTSLPATGAGNLSTKVAKALKLAKKANNNANAALAASKQPGPAGPTGPAGPAGSIGPSNGDASVPTAPVVWTFSQQTLASVPVQAGARYVFDSYVVADNNGGSGLQAFCRLRLTGTDLIDTTVTLGPNGTADDEAIALTGAGTATANGI